MSRIQLILIAICVIGGLLVGWAVVKQPSRRPQTALEPATSKIGAEREPLPVAARQPQAPPTVPRPQLGESQFVNTGPDAHYVGSQACAKCHESEYASYARTTHSQALDDIDLSQEPPDAQFAHELSGRDYQVYRQDGQLRHRETIKDEFGELVLADYPMRYVIGSGNHSRSYLVEQDGFLVESPVTWYTARQAWGMSPGYHDNPLQQGFARPARFLCVNCHAGEVTALGGSIHRLAIGEQAIGCERCHGPGSLHVERHRSGQANLADDGFDNTIVHPGRLSRERREAICGQCHLATVAHSQVRGRSAADFRPGQRLTDFICHYQLEVPDQAMSVVGHVEQLRLSKCYQASEMDCTTCHDPHGEPLAPDVAAAAYRATCLECHQPSSCGAEPELRSTRNDNCITCHMPTGPTDIPHFAFTHHRIGIHDETAAAAHPTRVGQLVPLNAVDHLPVQDQQRCLALAYLSLAESQPPPSKRVYHKRGLDMLYDLHQRGLRDPETEAALAWGFWRQNPQRCIEHAGLALQGKPLNAMARRDALSVVARTFVDTGRFAEAVDALRQLATLQRDAEDAGLLGRSLSELGKLNEAIKAVELAASIEPDRPDVQEFLGMLYARRGDTDRAARCRARATRLKAVRERAERRLASPAAPGP